MHSVTVRKEIVDRVLQRRGRYHLFDRLDPEPNGADRDRHADHVLRAGRPGRGAGIERHRRTDQQADGRASQLGVPVIWVLHANSRIGGKSDWELFFNTIVADDVRERTLESLAAEKQSVWSRARHRAGRPHGAEEPLQRVHPGLVAARAHASRHGDRHHSGRRHKDQHLLRIDRARRHDARFQGRAGRGLLCGAVRRRASRARWKTSSSSSGT